MYPALWIFVPIYYREEKALQLQLFQKPAATWVMHSTVILNIKSFWILFFKDKKINQDQG